MWIEWLPTDIPSIASRNGTIPPSGYRELLPLRLPFCQATSLLAHWSRLTPVDAARTPGELRPRPDPRTDRVRERVAFSSIESPRRPQTSRERAVSGPTGSRCRLVHQ